MSIQLKGNDESSFSDDVVIGSGKITLNGNGSASFASQVVAGGGFQAQYGPIELYAGNPFGLQAKIDTDGSAEFQGNINVGNQDQSSTTATGVQLNKVGVVKAQRSAGADINSAIFAAYKGSTNVWSVNGNGASSFAGDITAPNTFLALDTGGTLDVKERLQNTQAILYRLKAALIQPDVDANQLRARLLEALDILTSDGDES